MPRTYTLPLAIVCAALVVCVGALIAYDASTADSVADGVRVANVDVGGLDRADAQRLVRAELVSKLQRPLTIPVGDNEFHLTARESRVRTDVGATVDAAIDESRKGGIFSRTWRSISGGKRHVLIKPRIAYSGAAVDRLVARVRRALDRPAVDATVAFSSDDVAIKRAHTGRKVDAKRFRADVVAELLSGVGDRTVEVPLKTTRPKISTGKLASRYPTVVTIDRGAFRLTLFKHLERARTFPIAVGRVGLETPAGLYTIQTKEVNPAWHVPNSAWAGSLAGQTIPGGAPDNPLKSRWLGVYDGVGVHGTSDRGSIGSNASHGCIRMYIEDVVQLYDEVPIGTPIYIG